MSRRPTDTPRNPDIGRVVGSDFWPRRRRQLLRVALVATFPAILFCCSCSSKSQARSAVQGFFDDVNHANMESAKAKYLSVALKNTLDSPPAFRSHRSIHDSFGGVARQIKSVEITDQNVQGEQATEKVELTTPWGTKYSGTVDLIKEGGKDWKINDWSQFEAAGGKHVTTANQLCAARNGNAAIIEYQAAIAENPKDATLVGSLGQCYAFLGNFPQAEQTLSQAIAMYPDVVWDPYEALGNLYATQGKLPEAEKALKKALANKPEEPNAQASLYNNLAWFYADHGMNLDEAVRLSEKGLSLSPDNESILDTLGWAYYKKGDRDQALQYLTRAAAKEPNNQTIRAHVREASGNHANGH